MSDKRKLDAAFDAIHAAIDEGGKRARETAAQLEVAQLEVALATSREENERLVAELETLYTPGDIDLDEGSPEIEAFGLKEDNHNIAGELAYGEPYYVLAKNVMYRGTFDEDEDEHSCFTGVEMWTTKGWKRVTNKRFADNESDFFFLV